MRPAASLKGAGEKAVSQKGEKAVTKGSLFVRFRSAGCGSWDVVVEPAVWASLVGGNRLVNNAALKLRY